MLTSELLATLDHPIALAMVGALDEYATTLATIAAEIESANDDDAPTWAATLAIATKNGDVRVREYQDLLDTLKALRGDIYFDVHGTVEADSDRSVAIASAKDAYYAARRMAVLIETVCEVPGFVNNYLGSLDLPEGAGLRKSMKNVK